MADKQEATEAAKPSGDAEPAKKKTPLFLGGGALALVAVAYVLATMAVPKKEPKPHLEGPFVTKLSKTDIQVNLAGEGSKRYLVMSLNAEYFAYDEQYVAGRLGGSAGAKGGGEHGGGAGAEDPLYTAMLKDALLKLAATRTRDQVTDPVLIDAFLEDVRRVVDPILFPVHVGESHSPLEADPTSGLKVGESISESTFRGFLHEHALAVDAKRQTVAFDGGEAVAYEGKERDLELSNAAGERVYVDVTGLKPEFSGQVPIGVPGKVRRIYRDSFLVQ
jgi:hypothetical protein